MLEDLKINKSKKVSSKILAFLFKRVYNRKKDLKITENFTN